MIMDQLIHKEEGNGRGEGGGGGTSTVHIHIFPLYGKAGFQWKPSQRWKFMKVHESIEVEIRSDSFDVCWELDHKHWPDSSF